MSKTSIHALLLSIVAGLLSNGCFLKPKKKGSSGGGGKSDYSVVHDEVTMTRIGDGTSARLGFQTSAKVYCELAYYSQEDGGTPTKENPTVTECPNDEPRDDFLIRIDGLATDTLYWVVLKVYPDKESKEPNEEVLIMEEGGPNTVDPDDPDKPAGTYKELFVARMNVPLKSAEVHRHQFSSAQSISDIKGKLTRKTGCQSGIPDATGPFRTPSTNLKINNLATTSFGADKASRHDEYVGIRKLEYDGLNIGLDQWKFLYTRDDEDIEIKARSGNTIQSVEMASTENALLPDPQLASSVDALAIDPTKNLTLKWETDSNLLSSSYMLVYIGRPGNDTSIYCVFSAEDKTGDVPSDLLGKLAAEKHVVLTLLESNQFLATDAWYVSTYDWRSGRIEKL